VICDAIIIEAVDATFSLIHRRGATDTPLASWSQHFEPLGGGSFDAQAYELDVTAPAIEFQPGDQFVFRYSGESSAPMAFIPNGNGAASGGRIPNITFPE
jgi:hypothetical protein